MGGDLFIRVGLLLISTRLLWGTPPRLARVAWSLTLGIVASVIFVSLTGHLVSDDLSLPALAAVAAVGIGVAGATAYQGKIAVRNAHQLDNIS